MMVDVQSHVLVLMLQALANHVRDGNSRVIIINSSSIIISILIVTIIPFINNITPSGLPRYDSSDARRCFTHHA